MWHTKGSRKQARRERAGRPTRAASLATCYRIGHVLALLVIINPAGNHSPRSSSHCNGPIRASHKSPLINWQMSHPISTVQEPYLLTLFFVFNKILAIKSHYSGRACFHPPCQSGTTQSHTHKQGLRRAQIFRAAWFWDSDHDQKQGRQPGTPTRNA